MVFEIPSIFALRRYRTNIQDSYPDLESVEDITCLISSENLGQNKYRFTLLIDPIELLGETSVVEYEEKPAEFTHIRILERGDEMTTVASQGCLNIKTANEKIPVLQLLNPCRVLPDEFMDLKEHPEFYFWCKAGFNIGTSIVIQKQRKEVIMQKQTFPQHIVNLIVEDAIQHKKQCPIQFEDLTKDGSRVTPCGHIMSAAAVECWIRAKHSCPVCRVACSVGDLQTWK